MAMADETLSGRTPDGKKVTIRQNIYGNWYGFISGRRVEMFFNGVEKSQREAATEWLRRMEQGK